MAGLSIFYTYEPACSFLLHLSLSPVPVFSFHRLGSRAWQRVMKADSMRAALGKEGGRKNGSAPCQEGRMNRFRRKRCHRLRWAGGDLGEVGEGETLGRKKQ